MAGSKAATGDPHRFAPAAPEEAHVFGACCPGWHSTAGYEEGLDEWIAFMQDRGIERVCCLLSGDQLDGTAANTATYREAFGTDRVRHVPIADHHLADRHTLENRILPFLSTAVQRQEPVVVHCLAGIGRTGHVLAAWLVAGRTYDPIDALETVVRMGRSPAQAIDAGNARQGELHELLASLS